MEKLYFELASLNAILHQFLGSCEGTGRHSYSLSNSLYYDCAECRFVKDSDSSEYQKLVKCTVVAHSDRKLPPVENTSRFYSRDGEIVVTDEMTVLDYAISVSLML